MLVYMAFYMVGFMIVENAGHRHYHILHSVIDDMIPFCEYFVIPYFLWFVYMLGGILWVIFFDSKKAYYKLASTLAIGMTIFLVISCIFPNAQDLRPVTFERSNIFVKAVQYLYQTDTPTNILPSIHVYNSLVIFFALNQSARLQKHFLVRFGSGVLTASIILSTMFLKQHSIVDVSMGILMGIAVQMFCDRVFADEDEKAQLELAYQKSKLVSDR